MSASPGWRRFFRLAAFRPDPDGDLEAELEFHFRQTEEELVGEGLSPDEAREKARQRFGNLEKYKKELSRIGAKRAARNRRMAVLEGMGQDLAYVARGLARGPGFTVAVVLTLALGIGANSTMFSVVDHLLLRPPDQVRDPDHVVRLHVQRTSEFTGRPEVFSYMPFTDYQDFASMASLEATAAYGDNMVILGEGEAAERINALFSTTSFFSLLGVQPAAGRFFDDSENQPGAPGVAVLSYALWQRRYGGREDVLGRSVSIGNGRYNIVGVTPPGFNGVDLQPVGIFLPIHAFSVQYGSDEWVTHRGWYWLQALGRLPSLAVRDAAQGEATARHRNGRRDHMEQGRYSDDARVVLGSVHAARGPEAPGEVQVSRWLVGVTFIVLLIACANVTNLLLARGAKRRRELGIRVALGIPRKRLVGQLFMESLVLAGLGGALGLAMAYWGGRTVQTVFLPQVAWPSSPVNQRVLFFTAAVALGTGLLAGLVPALKGADEKLGDALREGGRGGTGGRTRSQSSLLVLQAALSVILLVGAGLFVSSLNRARTLDLGLEPEGLIVATPELDGRWDLEGKKILFDRAAERLEDLPGVSEASVATHPPFQGMWAFDVFVPDKDSIPFTGGRGPFVTGVSPDHLRTLGIQLRQGRMFTDQEAAEGAQVVVVSENMARGIWGAGSALGECLLIDDRDAPCWDVVGVVESSHLTEVTGEAPWQYYLPFGKAADELEVEPGVIMVRTRGDPHDLLGPVARELRGLDPGVRFANVTLQQDLIDPKLRSWKLGASMFSLFGILALVVAAVGLYSVLAFNVARRTRELGVRSAMGASRTRLLRMVLRQALGVTGAGVLLGLAVALLSSRFLGGLLFNTSPRDPTVLLGVAAALLAVAMAAAAIPAWAAARVDPMGALRTD